MRPAAHRRPALPIQRAATISMRGVGPRSWRARSWPQPASTSWPADLRSLVRMPRRCASTIPSFTSGVKPKSSALTTSRRGGGLRVPKLRAALLRLLRHVAGLPQECKVIVMTAHGSVETAVDALRAEPSLRVEVFDDVAIRAEGYGFDGVAINEHHNTQYCMNPAPNLTAAAPPNAPDRLRRGRRRGAPRPPDRRRQKRSSDPYRQVRAPST